MRKSMRALALVCIIGLLAVACGDDENGSSGGNDVAAPSDQAWCDSYVEAQAAVIAASSGGSTEEIPSLLDAVETDPPEEVADIVAEFIPQVREAVETEDDSVFESEEFSQADEELDVYVAENCGYASVDVTAVDYAFEGFSPTMAAGKTTFNWTNGGDEVHEMLLVKLIDESVKLEDLLEMSDKDAESKLRFVNASFGPPGTEDSETVTLEPGKYMVACFLPVGATDMEALETAEGPPHITKGMSAEFTVE